MTLLITRAEGTEAGLLKACAAAGLSAHWFSPLVIQPLAISSGAQKCLQSAAEFVVTSPNAARQLFRLTVNTNGRYLAVGQATADVLLEAGARQVLAPKEGAGADALLTMPEFEACQAAVIVKGEGGRDAIQQALSAKNVSYTEIDVYRRDLNTNVGQINDYLELLLAGRLSKIVISSQQSLTALIELTGEHKNVLLDSELLVTSGRLESFARQQGFVKLSRAASALTQDILAALLLKNN